MAGLHLSVWGGRSGGEQTSNTYRDILGHKETASATTEKHVENLEFIKSEQCSLLLENKTKLFSQWNLARLELGLGPAKMAIDITYLVLTDFYYTSHGAVTVRGRDNGPLTYLMIWKCGNDAIRKNLIAEEARLYDGNTTIIHDKLFDKKESHTAASYSRKLALQFGRKDSPPGFTFAREPSSHFVSGISEYYWRSFQKEFITADRLQNILRDILAMTHMNREAPSPGPSYAYQHYFAMAGVLKPDYNLKQLGRLENFDRDWDEISDTYGMNFSSTRFNRSLGRHESSDDPNGVKAAFKELFQRDVRYKRALCQLLFVDYVCFNYELPPECKDIKTSLDLPDDSDVFINYRSVGERRRGRGRARAGRGGSNNRKATPAHL
jgi:hypothetical protein